MFLAIFLGGSFVLCCFYEWVMLDVRSNLLHYIYMVCLAFSTLSCVSGKSPRGPVTSYVLAVGYPGGGASDVSPVHAMLHVSSVPEFIL